jgi:D-arabinose 1-dehydrogenase-like Zn-dependent alcohol dehydrogenase
LQRKGEPIVSGHEATGEVVRCGECYYCRTGQSNMCEFRLKRTQKVLGGFADIEQGISRPP